MRRNCFPLLVAAAIVLPVVAGNAIAATINYNDALPGQDLVYGGRSDVPVLFAFDVGVNTISGRMTYSSTGTPEILTSDVDGFQFSLGSNLRLDSVTLTYAFTGTPNSGFTPQACAVYQLYSTGPRTLLAQSKALSNYTNPCDQPSTPEVSSGGQLWASSLPRTGGVFEVANAMGTTAYGGGYIDYSYSFNVSTTAVPVPGSLGLFGLGLSSLAGFVRRRRAPRNS